MIICLPLTFAGASMTPTPESMRFACKRSGSRLLTSLIHYGKLHVVSTDCVLTHLLTHYSWSCTTYLHLLHNRKAWMVRGNRMSDFGQAPEPPNGLSSGTPRRSSFFGPRGQP